MSLSIITRHRLILLATTAVALLTTGVAQAALTDLADNPLGSASSSAVYPNIMFVLDDSGSMNWRFMPDGLSSRENRIGFRNHQCNLVYYNPGVRYVVPVTSTGGSINSGTPTSFTAAYNDGYHAYDGGSSATTDLSTGFRAFINNTIESNTATDEVDTAQPAYYWKYLGATTLVPLAGDCEKTLSASTNTTEQEYCTDNTRTTTTCAAAGKTALWKKIIVNSTSGPGTIDINNDGAINSGDQDERTNFANWYSYYNNRMKMMKSSSGRAFVNMTDTKRIGFVTINPNNPVTASKFLTIDNFDTTQKANWFTKLYSQTTNGSTPLREALSRVGRYFAHKTNGINNGMSGDPVQYSCQQNFTILTTDGYWNGSGGEKMDGTTDMDNQDGVISELDAYRPAGSKYPMSPRPIFDGASQTYTWNTASNQYQNVSCVFGTQAQQRSVQYQVCSATTVTPLETRTSTNSGSSWTGWTTNPTETCESDVHGTSRRQCRNGTVTATRTTSNGNSGSPTWSAWTATASCSDDSSGNDRRECRRQNLSCSGTWSSAQCTNADPYATPLCRSLAPSPWVDVGSCTPVAQDASGIAIECQNTDINGFKTQYLPTTTVTTYAGPGGPGGGTQILSGPTNTIGSWTDLPPGTCQATAPALPSNGTVTGSGPPAPPEGCASGSQVWPCETFSSGGGGVTASITALSVAGSADPFTVTATTSAAHAFIIGHSVTITGVTAVYGGFVEIIDVPDSTHFSYLVSTHPGVADGTGTATLSGGSSNSLADVAQYYYKTDLRTSTLGNCTGALGGSTSVCDDNVPATGTGTEDDRASWQHMTTFTMGLGLTGTVQYSPTYKTDSTTNVVIWPAVNGQITGRLDFQDIRLGTNNWPIPAADSPTALDDLWHAAVNGRGQYFSAGNPDTVVTSLTAALAGVSARVASAAAAATSNLEPVAGDNFAYTAKYKTQAWTGDLEAREIDLVTGAVSGTVIWSAQAKLDAATRNACDNRTIKLFRSGATDNLVDFKWNTDTCDVLGVPVGSPQTVLNAAEQGNFGATQIALLSQYPVMGDGTGITVDQRTPAVGANLVNYIRGQRGKEGFSSGPPITNTSINTLYRTREHILGDIINAQPVFVKAPFAEYDDAGYTAYKTANAARTPMVFTAANDGTLHAFYAGTSIVDTSGGNEAWGFIPTMVLPNLYKLASENYATQHIYSVDGTPTAGDVYDTADTAWKTILVGGLNKGGQGYYALDITDPVNPKGLWEFKHSSTCFDSTDSATWYADCHIGYTFSNPIISKLRDGRWVVFVTSGYNNVNAPSVSGDGVGYLYVLEAMTGRILYKISTGAGSAATPSGLNHINAWTENSLRNNQTERVYGVDVQGNIWRFDVNDVLAPAGIEAIRVATVVDGSGTVQPITTRPELAEVGGQPFVYVGTGRYLGTTDNSDTQTQSVWALRDPLTTTSLSSLRTTLKQMTITNQGSGTTAFRTIGCTAQCGSTDGWFADLPDSGERVNVDIKLQLGTLVVASNVPLSNACNIGGYSWLNYFNSATGGAVANSANQAVGRRLVGADGTESLAVGINIVRLPGGKTVVIATTSAAQQVTVEAPFDIPPPTGKRISWREIIQ